MLDCLVTRSHCYAPERHLQKHIETGPGTDRDTWMQKILFTKSCLRTGPEKSAFETNRNFGGILLKFRLEQCTLRAEYHTLIGPKQLNSCVIVPAPQRRGTETRLYGGGHSPLRTRLRKFPCYREKYREILPVPRIK